MDDDWYDGDSAAPTVLLGARILRVEFLTSSCEWIGPILYQCQPALFPSGAPSETSKWTLSKALRQFRGLPVQTAGGAVAAAEPGVEEEPPDIDALINAAGVGDDEAELVHSQAFENRAASLRLLVGVGAQCLVEYSPAHGGAQRQQALVLGEWPALSSAVRYDIEAMPFAGDVRFATTPRFDALRRECRIVPHVAERASIGEFHAVLLHGMQKHSAAANHLVRTLFPSVYQTPASDASRVVSASLRGADGRSPVDCAAPLDATFLVDELRTAIGRSHDISWHAIDASKMYFQAATLFFHAAEMRRIADTYRARNRWFDVLARGRAFVLHVDYLLGHAPHVLCARRLKFIECARKQKELKAQRKRLATQRDAPRGALTQLDTDCAAMRGLLTLPEMRFAQYRETLAANAIAGRANVLNETEQRVVLTALDIYALVLHDQAESGDLYANMDHAQRVRASEHGATSGHMFTVIDSTPRARLVGCDSAASLGAVSLADWPLDDAPPAPAETPSAVAVDDDEWDADARPSTLSLPDLRALRQPTAPAAVQPVVAAGPQRAARDFSDAISRLAIGCSPAQFVAGLRWLVDKSVLTRVPMIGTGPTNQGRPFDAFYLSSVHSAQTRCVSVLQDIYARGVADALRQRAVEEAPGYSVAAATAAHDAAVREFRETCAFFTRAREYARALGHKHADLVAKTVPASAAPLEAGSEAGEPPAAPEHVLAMAETLYAEVLAFIAGEAPPLAADDPYASLLPLAETGRRRTVYGLLKRPTVPDIGGSDIELCAEQLRAIERSLVAPISIITGRAGTGKTEVLRRIVAPYPPEQVLVTAFTGKVVSELTRRVHTACTTHSLLFRDVLHKREVKRVEALLAGFAASARTRGQEHTPLARIAELRAALYRLLGVAEHASPFENVRVLVIDEASLMPFWMFEALLTAVHDYERRSGRFLARIVVCGDPWQLHAIGYGSVLADLMRAFPWCVHHMTINHRSEGRAIFQLANDIAMQRLGTRGCPFPTFGGPRNEARLMTPTQCRFDASTSVAEQEEAKRAANDASVVFMPASRETLGTVLRDALELLGTLAEPATPEVLEMRNSVLMIASTRHLVGRLNSICRSLFFAETFTKLGGEMQYGVNGELLMPPVFEHRIVPGDRIILRRNWRTIHYVDADDADAPADDPAAAGGGVVSEAVARLERVAYASGLQTTAPKRRVYTLYYNGELLQVMQFYDAPRVITARTRCRCGLCAEPDDDDDSPGSCVLAPFDVPLGRRVPANLDDPYAVKYHSQNMQSTRGGLEHCESSKRRMAVLRVVNEPTRYKEVDVGARLGNATQFAFLQAATVHVIQGSEAPIVFFVIVTDSPHVDWTAVYTAVTRPRQRLVVVGDPLAFQNAVRRQPPLRRSDFWALLAIEAGRVHRKHHAAADPWRIARALRIDDAVTKALVDTRRDVETMTRRELWDAYDRVKDEALARSADDASE